MGSPEPSKDINDLYNQYNQLKQSDINKPDISNVDAKNVQKENKISYYDERHHIVNDFLKEIKDLVSEEQKDLRSHRKKGIKYISIFLGISTIAVFGLLYIMILYEKGSVAIQLSLVGAIFADSLGLVYIVFKYLFSDSHKIFVIYKEILEVYEKNQ